MEAKERRAGSGNWLSPGLGCARALVLSVLSLALLLPLAWAQRPIPPAAEEPSLHRPTAVQLRKESYKEVKKAAQRMLKAAEELRSALDKPDDFRPAVIAEKAAQIERAAKRIQSKMKGF